jgi:rhodanese-related sulfurtransferase
MGADFNELLLIVRPRPEESERLDDRSIMWQQVWRIREEIGGATGMGQLRKVYRWAAIGLSVICFGACRPASSVDAPQAGDASDADASDEADGSLDSIKSLVESDKAVLVDVREPAEWAAGHFDRAVSLPLSELRSTQDPQQLRDRLPADKVVYTHCAAGKRSVRAAEILSEYGYDVRPITQSYEEMREAGFAEEAP